MKNFQERMAWAVARSKQVRTQTQTRHPVTTSTTTKKQTPEQYQDTTLQRVLTKMKLMRGNI